MLRIRDFELGKHSMGWVSSALSDISCALFGDTIMNWIMGCIVWTGHMDRHSALVQSG